MPLVEPSGVRGRFFVAPIPGETPATKRCEDEMSAPTVETPATETPAAPTTPPVETTEEPFDKDRAMATISKLREYEKEAKRLQSELDKRTKAEADAEAARLKDEQKWEQLAKSEEEKRIAAEQTLEAERLTLRTRLAQAEIRAIAGRLKFHKPEVAYRLIDTDKLEYDDEGMPTNAEALLTELAKSDDYLIAKDEDQRRGIPATPRGANPAEVAQVMAGDLAKDSERRVRQVF